jgi:hypothetical protein
MSMGVNGNQLSMFNACRPRALVAVVVAFIVAFVVIRHGVTPKVVVTNTREDVVKNSWGSDSTRELAGSNRKEATRSSPPLPTRPSAGAMNINTSFEMVKEENEVAKEGARVASQGRFTVMPLPVAVENVEEGSDDDGPLDERDKFLVKLRVNSDPGIESESPAPETEKYEYKPKKRSLLKETIFDAAMAIDDIQSRRQFLAAISRKKVCFHHVPKTGGTNFVFKGMFKALFHWQQLEVCIKCITMLCCRSL